MTYESLDDILGTNNLFGLVTQQGIWGTWWRTEFLQLGVDVVDFIERRVRYCALYSIPLITLAFALLPRQLHSQSRPAPAIPLALSGVVALLWVWLCATIVLTWAATDNLTELIGAHGPFGIPGPMFLFGVFVVMAANVEVLLRARHSAAAAIIAVVVSGACVGVSWLLLNAGLEPNVHKYGFVFSGAQFLLGPDRQHGLSALTLFVRWAAVYVGGVCVVALGAWIGEIAIAGAQATWGRSQRSVAPEVP